MALVAFLCSIILTSFIFINVTAKDTSSITTNNNLPQMVFVNSTLYELNQRRVDKIVKAKQAIQYEKKEELKDATLILRGSNNTVNTISGKYMKKENDIYEFRDDVVFKKDDMQLKTQSVKYNDTTGIVSNQVSFLFNYKNSTFTGNTLYLSKNDFAISGKQAHFVLNEKDL